MNNACSYGEERLASLLYEDGDEGEMMEMRAHLATCADCRAEFEDLTSMKDLLSAWPNAVNVPRMVYVNDRSSFLARLQRWGSEIGRLGMAPLLKPLAAAAAMVVVVAVSIAVLDVRVAPDGRVQIGFGGGPPAAENVSDVPTDAGAVPISRAEFQEGLTQTVSYLEDMFRSRSDDERRLLMAAIDERMQQQGMAMSQQLRGAVNAALTDMEQQHENELGLVFSAIDELGVVTGMELQRMNNILASLMQREPGDRE
jgi:hypothetical protein